MYRVVCQSTGKKWREYKHTLRKNHFRDNLSLEQNFKRKPLGRDEAEWQHLVRYFMSPKGQKRHVQGKKSRSLQKLLHNTGRKGFGPKRKEMMDEKDGKVIGPMEFFEATHKRKSDGELNDEAACVMEIVRREVDEKKGDSNCSDHERFNLEQEAFLKTLGPEKPGCVRGFGFGVTITQVYGSSRANQAANSQVEELKRQIQEMKEKEMEKDQELQRQLQEMKEREMEKEQEMQRQLQEMKEGEMEKEQEMQRQLQKMKEREMEKEMRIKKMEEDMNLMRKYILSSQSSNGSS